ncbi:choline transporter-like protein 1 [Alosa sapidissima]|uniref:choline transporter-like protein 1 n=1 Tax=Alosa sapidissima TaxID=34773 RepID=UPI001C0916E2|nr:choline transporter-like protein 1 [Alosa sapidissima]
MACFGNNEKRTEWTPLEERSVTDIPWLIFFILFCIGMVIITGLSIAMGGTSRLVKGYDSYGNICGQNNSKTLDIPQNGGDFTQRKFVFFLEPCKIDLVNRKMKSIALCVSKCPEEELKTLEDVRKFAIMNGSKLCRYDIEHSSYPSHPDKAAGCPQLPVKPSKARLNRCVPVDVSCYAQFAQALVNSVSENVFQRIAAGVMASKEIIFGLCMLSIVLSGILMVVIRYISAVLVMILTVLVVLGSIAGTGVLWWLYVDLKKSTNSTSPVEQAIAQGNTQGLLAYAITATVFTVVLLLLIVFLRKRVALTIALFHVAGNVFTHIPLLALQPVWTCMSLLLFWVCWLGVLLSLGTSGSPVLNTDTQTVEFKLAEPLQYMVWYHAVGLIWVSEFILACQQMTVAGAVVTYYFTRNKSQLPVMPILTSVLRLARYHLGTVAKGAFIITLVEIPRLILTYIHTQLKGKENACARCMLKACICCLWCLKKCLQYLNQNAYTATAINSTSFCTSAQDAFIIMVENVVRVAVINTVGTFILFLGKVLVVSCTAFVGVLTLRYQQEYTVWVVPVIIACLFAYLVAHCFLSVYDMVVDVLFLCFAIDSKYNDGSRGKEYYMEKALMEFVENSRKAMERDASGGSKELTPMARRGR